MALKLYAPGTRKNKVHWVAYGKIDGRPLELSTQSTTQAGAKAWLKAYRKFPRPATPPKPVARKAATQLPAVPVTFGDALLKYARNKRELDLDCPRAYRTGQRQEIRRLRQLKDGLPAVKGGRAAIKGLGSIALDDITEDMIKEFAHAVLPQAIAATKNRDVITLARAVLSYAARQGWCRPVAIARFKEAAPKTKAVHRDAERALLEAAPAGKKHLLLLWLFRQGSRIQEALDVTWAEATGSTGIDLDKGEVRIYIGKTDEVAPKALNSEVIAELEKIPAAERHGKLFSWGSRQNVYRWLKPLSRSLGLDFSCHMARHSVGTNLNAQGAGLRTIMDVLNHRSPVSSMRYQAAGIEISRAAIDKLGAA